MAICAKEYVDNKSYMISGISYIGNPKSNTAMFITKKVEHLLTALNSVEECLIFAETGIVISKELESKHAFRFSTNPQLDYTRFANYFASEELKEERKIKFTLTADGYYVSDDVRIPGDAYIEPGCMIGPKVNIGDNAQILSGAIIRHTTIGNNFLVNQYAVIGGNGFTMTKDEDGNNIRIPTLGKVVIGDNVEVGAHDNISRGSGGDTIICDYVKLDSMVHVGHDVYIGRNTEIASGTILGGFDKIGERIFIGMNSTVRNRISVGNDVFVSMGSAVMKTVESDLTVAGNPARKMPQKV